MNYNAQVLEGPRQRSDFYMEVRGHFDGPDKPPVWRAHHRILAMRAMGRELIGRECVHHRDGNRSNNEIVNLIVLPNPEVHRSVHTLILGGRLVALTRVEYPYLRAMYDAACESDEGDIPNPRRKARLAAFHAAVSWTGHLDRLRRRADVLLSCGDSTPMQTKSSSRQLCTKRGPQKSRQNHPNQSATKQWIRLAR